MEPLSWVSPPGLKVSSKMKNFHLRGKSPLEKFERLIKGLKLVLFDITLLILFVLALVKIIRVELGW